MENQKEIQEMVKSKMQRIATGVEQELPPNFGFVVLAFPFGESGQNELMYVSNSNRDDVIKAMMEFVDKTKNTYGNDTGKY